MLIVLSPVARWVLRLQFWLFGHGYFWLGIHLPHIIRGVFVYGLVALWLAEIVREILLLWVVPKRARRLATLGRNEKSLALMQSSVRAFTPLLGTRPLYLTRAYSLGVMLQNAGRFGEACEVWQQIARRRGLAPGFEADVRRRFANDLENEGDARGAARQRDIARQKLDRTANTRGGECWSVSLQNAKSAQDANDFPAALQLFERALDAPKFGLLGAQRDAVEAELACHVSLAAHHCGDNARAQSAARQTIELAKNPFMRAQGYRCLANALSTQNRLDDALDASRAALSECEEHGDEQIVADSRAQYALLLTNMGQVEAALRECEIAADMGLHASRMALHGAANCHSLRGDYAAARDCLERARRTRAVPAPAAERQMQGLLDMEGANIELSATRYGGANSAQTAWDLLQRAKPNLLGFERLLFWLRATEMSALAQLGQSDAARNLCDPIAAELENYAGDTAAHSAVWTHLAQTRMELGDWSEAARWWRTYLDSPFGRPVYRASALCDLGVCLRHLGEESAALDCWRQVIELDFPINATQRARALV